MTDVGSARSAADVGAPPASPLVATPTPARRTLRKFTRHRLAIFGLAVLALFALLAIFAPLIAPYDYAEQDLTHFRQPPSAAHVLGTDSFGRDVLTRVLYGGRVSLQ